MKKIVTFALVLALLASLGIALAGQGGTASDPLITRSWLEDVYIKGLLEELSGVIDRDLAAALPTGSDAPVTDGAELFGLAAGRTVTLSAGSGIILTEGDLTVTVLSGEVIDISAAAPVPTGTALAPYIRYFCAEDTVAEFSSKYHAVLSIDGAYCAEGGLYRLYSLYSDTAGWEWYSDAAAWARDRQIYRDWDAAEFRQGNPVTRAEAVYAIWTAAGSPAPESAVDYGDLTEDWYRDAISWASLSGVVEGTPSGGFFPDEPLTRSMLAAMLKRSQDARGIDTSQRADITVFADYGEIAEKVPWFTEEISWGVAAGVIRGFDTGLFAPLEPATRAQLATLLMRMN